MLGPITTGWGNPRIGLYVNSDALGALKVNFLNKALEALRIEHWNGIVARQLLVKFGMIRSLLVVKRRPD
jgi:hypothetical protein